jgi:hypothetical protein
MVGLPHDKIVRQHGYGSVGHKNTAIKFKNFPFYNYLLSIILASYLVNKQIFNYICYPIITNHEAKLFIAANTRTIFCLQANIP